jgi:cytochrome c
MKKIDLIILVLVLTALSCGQKEKKSTEDYGTPTEEVTTPPAVDVIAQGESLVKANDCKTCHHKTNKIIGPAHLDVAKKYEFTEANIKLLADKIIKGGQGVWGQIPMTAHADLSQADAETMARYILSLDGEKQH